MDTGLREIIAKYNPNRLIAEASTPPSSWYTDHRILELEHRAVFSHSWQMVGRADQVREPGKYLTCQIAGEPILIIRGNDGICGFLQRLPSSRCRYFNSAARQS